ncbi:MAG TPA: S9 family peptidase [Chloroflexota bacterium]|nr:S9 family peptidase [Chloroflexota bacterium]
MTQHAIIPPTLSDIVTFPQPGMNMPGSVQFSPDGRWLTYLYSEAADLTRQLVGRDLQTGEVRPIVHPPDGGATDDNISLEETLRRERMRQREFGVTQYAWSAKKERLLIPLRGSIYVQDGVDSDLRLLVSGDVAPCLDARFSPDGEWVAYVQDAELYVVPAAGGQPQQVTSGARGTGKTNGLAEYIAQEELGRSQGYWWSPDSQWLAFAEVDETHIPIYRIVHQGKDAVGEGAQEDHRYPFAGMPNARVRLGVISRTGGAPIWMDLGEDDEVYLARVKWLPTEPGSVNRLTAQLLNRAQDQLDLLVFDAQTGTATRLLRESSQVWINLHKLFYPLKDGRFLWGSERTGFQHLYLYAGDGSLIHQLTAGDWPVETIAGVDEKAGLVYFTAAYPTPLDTQLLVVSLDGGAARPLTPEPGTHGVEVDVKNGRFTDTHHSLSQPPIVTLRSLADGAVQQTIHQPDDPRLENLLLPPPEIFTLPNRQGVTLYGAIYRPPAHFGSGPFPTIVAVYGGPHAQTVANRWLMTVDMRAQYLAQQGFLVFKLDNQGSTRRGLAFESVIKHNLGDVEVQDQVDGVRWLAAQGLADPSRVGVYGWSYGGYMTIMCLCRAADTFQVGVAGAPASHWDGYDTGYTERYMGTPQNNPDGYASGAVTAHVDNLQGKLLLIHGLIDENVHFRHTARLINALNRAQRPYDLLIFPDERHMPRKPADRLYLEKRLCGYFQTHLARPEGFSETLRV